MGAAEWSSDFRTREDDKTYYDYGVFNMGPHPLPDGRVVFNGLGSKGSLYAPGAAEDLTVWLAGKGGLDAGLDVREWQGNDE
jgi:hypothetical protein